jgi:taurine dioxygenase
LLDSLNEAANRPEYQCRLRWRTGTVAIWDNRGTKHYAVHDYGTQRRRMQRITVAGEVPE